MHLDDCCGQYRGKLSARLLGQTQKQPLLCLGNSQITITNDVSMLTANNYESFGGTVCNIPIVNGMTLNLVLSCTSLENLMLAFSGKIDDLADATVTEVLEYVAGDCVIPFSDIPNPNEDIIVTDGDTPTPTTFVEGEDYERTAGGIRIIDGSSIVAGNLTVTYDTDGGKTLKLFVGSNGKHEIYFEGYKITENGKIPVTLKLWQVKFRPAADFALVGDDLPTLTLVADILAVESKPTDSEFGVLQTTSKVE